MNAEYEMALLLKQRENIEGYTPVFGVVEQLPDIRIRLSERIVLDADNLASILDLKRQDADNNYIWLGRRVYLLPMYNLNKAYLVIGGDEL